MAKKQEKDDAKLHYAQMHGLPRISLTEASQQIELTLLSGQTRGCIVLVGESGCGKTQVFGQIASKHGYKLITINVANFNLMSGGIPSTKSDPNIPAKEDKYFKIKVPEFFPKPGEKAIVFFDEINRGMPTAIATFFNLLEDRRLYDYKLPDDCMVVGAMNPGTKNYSVTSVENEAAMRRRIKFLYVIPTFSSFMNHAKTEKFHKNSTVPVAKNKPCHPDVLAFISSKPKTTLYDNKAKDKNQQYACPAVWETVSEDCYLIQELSKHTLNSEFAQTRIASSVGEPMAASFTEFISNNSQELNAQNILTQYNKTEKKIVAAFKGTKNGKLGQACTDVSALFFGTKPNLNKTLPNLMSFWEDLPEDIAQSAIRALHENAKENNAEDYFEQFMQELNTNEDVSDRWQSLHVKLDSGIRANDTEISNNGKKKERK